MDTPRNYRPHPVSFVRRGNRLQGSRETAWREHATEYVIDVPRLHADTSIDPSYVFDAAAIFGRQAKLIVEIGSGLGHAIVHAAEANPSQDFLAVEVYRPGLAQTMKNAATRGLSNLRVVQANAPEVLDTMLPPASVTEVWTFFPDPWPKARHEKRRLINAGFIELVTKALRPQGLWRVATDWEHYAEQILAIGEDSPLKNLHESWAPRYSGRILTNFEKKALTANRKIRDLTFIKP